MTIEQPLPTVSIIVLNYNGKEYLEGCLASIDKVFYPKDKLEVIFVDNGSSDGSTDCVKSTYPWVKVIALKKNCGFTGGNNIGVKYAQGSFIVFLNNDVVVDKNWLMELVKVAVDNPTSLVTSKSLFFNIPEVVDHAGTKATFIGRSFSINFGRKNDSLEVAPKYVIQPYGASMLIKKTIFEDLGEFDDSYFASLEDTDLGFKAWMYGYKVIYVPTSIFYHFGGGTGGWGSRITNIMVFHITKNSYMNIIKYYNFQHIIQGVMFSLLYYSLASLLSIKEHRVDSIKPLLQAHIWVIKNVGQIMQKRRDIVQNSRVNNRVLFTPRFFASFSEMLQENAVIQNFYKKYYA